MGCGDGGQGEALDGFAGNFGDADGLDDATVEMQGHAALFEGEGHGIGRGLDGAHDAVDRLFPIARGRAAELVWLIGVVGGEVQRDDAVQLNEHPREEFLRLKAGGEFLQFGIEIARQDFDFNHAETYLIRAEKGEHSPTGEENNHMVCTL